jgi:hypothetical protein
MAIPQGILDLSRKLSRGRDYAAEYLLCSKCNWEHMSRSAVLMEWGNPRFWPDYEKYKNDPALHEEAKQYVLRKRRRQRQGLV